MVGYCLMAGLEGTFKYGDWEGGKDLNQISNH